MVFGKLEREALKPLMRNVALMRIAPSKEIVERYGNLISQYGSMKHLLQNPRKVLIYIQEAYEDKISEILKNNYLEEGL